MDLSVQNKKFLEHLHKLGVDVKQFSDNTFDGLFDNVPGLTNHFFNWFIENITSDNILTEIEQATYFELDKNQLLPTEEEVNFILNTCNPSFEELQSLDTKYVNNYLMKELEDLNEIYGELTNISLKLNECGNNVMKKHKNLKENINIWKKQLNSAKENCHSANQQFNEVLNHVEEFLLAEPKCKIDMDYYNSIQLKESLTLDEIFDFNKLLHDNIFGPITISLPPMLEDNLSLMENFLIMSQGSLKEENAKIGILTDILQKHSLEESLNNCMNYNVISFYSVNDESFISGRKDMQTLECELNELVKQNSHEKVQAIKDQYLSKKIDVNKTYLSQIFAISEYIKSSMSTNSILYHIIIDSLNNLSSATQIRKDCHAKLRKLEGNFSNDISSFELRKQRFIEISTKNEHPFAVALKGILNFGETFDDNPLTHKNLNQLITYASDDANFVTHQFRTDFQSSIKKFLSNFIYGPTSQIMLTDINLLIKLEKCQYRDEELSKEIKRFANKYVKAKETISRNDRSRALLWMDFLSKTKSP